MELGEEGHSLEVSPTRRTKAVVTPNRAISQANPGGFLVPYRSIVQMIELTSWSKKNNTVMMTPGTRAAKARPIGRFQNCTKNSVRSGEVGRKEVLIGSFILSSVASSPTCG